MAVDQAALLVVTVRREMPLLILADLKAKSDVVEAIKTIKANPDTSHIPVIAFAPETTRCCRTPRRKPVPTWPWPRA